MKDGPKKDAVTHFMGQIELLQKCAVNLSTIEHILRINERDIEDPEAKQAFRFIHKLIFQRLANAYETMFAWALIQPKDMQEKAKTLAQDRWGKTFAELAKTYEWDELPEGW